MNAPDYHDISTSIAEIIAKTSKPLAEQQKIALVGSVSIWLLQRDKRIEDLEKGLHALVHAHNGYGSGAGPCICGAHEDARKLLARSSQGKGADHA